MVRRATAEIVALASESQLGFEFGALTTSQNDLQTKTLKVLLRLYHAMWRAIPRPQLR
jgi:hypothetical protein